MRTISGKQFFLFFGALFFLGVLVGGVFFWLHLRQQQLAETTSIEQGQEIIEQEVGWEQFPLAKEHGSYHFLCLSGDVVSQQPPIKLPTGQEISHTLPCVYYDLAGQKQTLHLPLYTYHLEQQTSKQLGYKVKTKVPERLIQNTKKGWTERWPGTMSWLERAGWTGPGHIFYVAFVLPTTDTEFEYLSSEAYFNQAMRQMVTSSVVEEFAQTGQTQLLSRTRQDEALLLPIGVSFNSRFAALQEDGDE